MFENYCLNDATLDLPLLRYYWVIIIKTAYAVSIPRLNYSSYFIWSLQCLLNGLCLDQIHFDPDYWNSPTDPFIFRDYQTTDFRSS